VNRVLIACVGNILRGDDGFGVAVAQALQTRTFPPGVDLMETGIGGMSIVQELMDGYEALIIVDAVDRGAPPGTLFVLQPDVPSPEALSTDEWRAQFSNLHLAEPSRILLLARAAGVLPPRVAILGCQPECLDDFNPGLSPTIAAAVAPACERTLTLAATFATVPVG
jgi:hydrogenase maturation protease